MREVIQKLEEVELDLADLYRDMVGLKSAGGTQRRIIELIDEVSNLIIDLEDELCSPTA